MPNIVTVDTTRLPVHSVSVFQSDRAEIRRIIPVELKNGQNEVCIERLPSCLHKDSIRVDGLGNAVIFDVIHTARNHAGRTVTDNNNLAESDSVAIKALNETQKHLVALQTEREIVKYQMDMLAGYAKTITTGQVDHSKLASFLELYDRRKKKLDEDLQNVEENIQSAQNLEKKQREGLRLDDASKKRTVKVTVIVLADGDGPAELSLSYGKQLFNYFAVGKFSETFFSICRSFGSLMVPFIRPSRENWCYGSGGDGKLKRPNNSLSIHYRASITQSTGEDWTDVALDLSTASPHLGANIPSLTTYHIGTPPPPPPPPVMRSKSAKGSFRASHSMVRGGQLYIAEEVDIEPMQMFALQRMALMDSRAVEGAISTNFIIHGLSTVPSDLDTYHKTEHKVTVAEFELDPMLEWIAVPKMQASAFLR
ncbi:hypothetical protein FRB97_005913, partial [Tulasnella sp. 331]